jgi:hypothetical protein
LCRIEIERDKPRGLKHWGVVACVDDFYFDA